MTISANNGPLITFGQSGSTAPGQEYNEQAGPSLFYQGAGTLDPRSLFTYIPGRGVTRPVYGFLSSEVIGLNVVPTTLAANNIAASQSPAAGTITLVSASGAGVTVGVSITRGDTGATVTGLLALDTAHTPVTFGQSAGIAVWDPSKLLSRCIRYVSGGNDSGIT